jgi:hypothetical protein
MRCERVGPESARRRISKLFVRFPSERESALDKVLPVLVKWSDGRNTTVDFQFEDPIVYLDLDRDAIENLDLDKEANDAAESDDELPDLAIEKKDVESAETLKAFLRRATQAAGDDTVEIFCWSNYRPELYAALGIHGEPAEKPYPFPV